MSNIVSRQEARALGLKLYFTGKPCKYGHISERYASKGKCVQCAKEFDKDEAKKYYVSNRDHILKVSAMYKSLPEYKERNAEHQRVHRLRRAYPLWNNFIVSAIRNM